MVNRLKLNTRKDKRTQAYWILLAGFFLATLAGAARMIYSISDWYWLNFSGVQPGPLYLAITGGAWALVGLAALVWVGFHLPRYRAVGMGAALLWAVMYWLDRLLVRNPQAVLPNTMVVATLTVLGVLFVAAVLYPPAGLRAAKGDSDGEVRARN